MSVDIRCGDSLALLRKMPDQSVHCVVTSPPYFGLRDYQTAKWHGGDAKCDHRKTSAQSAAVSISTSTLGPNRDGVSGQAANGHQQEGFRDLCRKCGARRIDKQMGLERTPEKYVANLVAVFREVRRVLRNDGTVWLNLGDSYAGGGNNRGGNPSERSCKQRTNRGGYGQIATPVPLSLKPKDLIGIPWRVAFALQADGWYLRSDIIWHKPNPMPESVTDRPTKAHEYVFLLSKSARYFYDAAAVAEACTYRDDDRKGRANPLNKEFASPMSARMNPHRYGSGNKQRRIADGLTRCRTNSHLGSGVPWEDTGRGRNRRTVWTIATQPYKGAHFATFPEKLIEPCVLAGCPEGGTVLDIFAGSGTVGVIAKRHGRNFIGLELNPAYVKLAHARLAAAAQPIAKAA